MKDMYDIEIEGREVNVNSPECYNKDPERAEYVKMGFQNKEDYERSERRNSDRKKV